MFVLMCIIKRSLHFPVLQRSEGPTVVKVVASFQGTTPLGAAGSERFILSPPPPSLSGLHN